MTEPLRPDVVIQLEARLGYRFREPALLELALRHASIAESRVSSNERLEFLGDAILGLVVCELVYLKYPGLLEGEMTKIKSAVVSRQQCAQMAEEAGLVEHLQLGKGMKGSSALPTSLAAASLESVVGAIYLDGGLDPAKAFLVRLVAPRVERAALSGHQENFKSILQQHAQQELDGTPAYIVLSHKGPDHAKHFQVLVQIGDRRFQPAWGASKKQAEQSAALLALSELGLLTPEGRPVPPAHVPTSPLASASASAPAAPLAASSVAHVAATGDPPVAENGLAAQDGNLGAPAAEPTLYCD